MLPVYWELSNLLLRRMFDKERTSGYSRTGSATFHVPPYQVQSHIWLLHKLWTVRGTLCNGHSKCTLHALTAGRDGEDVRIRTRCKHGSSGSCTCWRTYRAQASLRHRWRSDLQHILKQPFFGFPLFHMDKLNCNGSCLKYTLVMIFFMFQYPLKL